MAGSERLHENMAELWAIFYLGVPKTWKRTENIIIMIKTTLKRATYPPSFND